MRTPVEAWATLFGGPPFDRVLPEHFLLAFDRGMAEHLAEVEAVAGALLIGSALS